MLVDTLKLARKATARYRMERVNCVIKIVMFLTCYDCGTELSIFDQNDETGRVKVKLCNTCKRNVEKKAYAEGVAAMRKAILSTASATEVLFDGSE